MPEKPEVVTVAKKLSLRLVGRKIFNVRVLWDNIIEKMDPREFEKKLKNEEILEISTRGKWLVFTLTDELLIIHLRMEGKFFFRKPGDEIGKHEHVIFLLDNGEELRFADVRKFGKMRILKKELPELQEPFSLLGMEPWDPHLTPDYLFKKYKKKTLPIKSVLLDQSIITGIGNIYADEILFLSKIHPLQKTNTLKREDCQKIIENTIQVLDQAILEGGTTIRSYTSEERVTGLFQNHLFVHTREGKPCVKCGEIIQREKIGGRSSYFCPSCQKERKTRKRKKEVMK